MSPTKRLIQDDFLEARLTYWRGVLKQHHPRYKLTPRLQLSAPETNFLLSLSGPGTLAGVFEDDGDTGYLYLYDSASHVIVNHVHLYDRSPKVQVLPADVRLMWSGDGEKLAVAIWGQIRGIIDRTRERPGRIWIESHDSPGITDAEWLCGFERSGR